MQDMWRCGKLGSITPHPISNSRIRHAAKCGWASYLQRVFPQRFSWGQGSLSLKVRTWTRSAGEWTTNVNGECCARGPWWWGLRLETWRNHEPIPWTREPACGHLPFQRILRPDYVAAVRWDLSVFLSPSPSSWSWSRLSQGQHSAWSVEERKVVEQKVKQRECPHPCVTAFQVWAGK